MKTKTAMITIAGRPNVGKSTLANALVGEKIAIVSHKPQTTRNRICAIVDRGDTQLVFIDTPGLIKPKNSLGDYMVKSVTQSVAGVDACLLVAEAQAAGIQKVAEAINGKGGIESVNMQLAQQYLAQFGNLAKTNNTMIIPSDLANVAGVLKACTAIIRKTEAAG